MALFRGVTAIPFDAKQHAGEQLHTAAIAELKQRNFVSTGDYVLLTKGSLTGELGGTDSLKILTVP